MIESIIILGFLGMILYHLLFVLVLKSEDFSSIWQKESEYARAMRHQKNLDILALIAAYKELKAENDALRSNGGSKRKNPQGESSLTVTETDLILEIGVLSLESRANSHPGFADAPPKGKAKVLQTYAEQLTGEYKAKGMTLAIAQKALNKVMNKQGLQVTT